MTTKPETAMLSGAEMVVQSLIEEGVEQIFGYPGGSVLDIYDALHAKTDEIKHSQKDNIKISLKNTIAILLGFFLYDNRKQTYSLEFTYKK